MGVPLFYHVQLGLHSIVHHWQPFLSASDITQALHVGQKPPLLIKIAPDLTDADMTDIATIALDKSAGIDGLIVSNTTITRPDSLSSSHKSETGGLSGRPLFEPSTAVLKRMFQLTQGRVPIIGACSS